MTHTSRCAPLTSAMPTIVLPQSGDVQDTQPYQGATVVTFTFQNKRERAVWVSVTIDARCTFIRRGKTAIAIVLRTGTHRVLTDNDIDQVTVQAVDPNSQVPGYATVWTEDLNALSNNDDCEED